MEGDKNAVISGIPLPPAPGILYHPSARFLPTYFLFLSGLPPQPSCSSELRGQLLGHSGWTVLAAPVSGGRICLPPANQPPHRPPPPALGPWPLAADSCSGTLQPSLIPKVQAGSGAEGAVRARAHWQGRQKSSAVLSDARSAGMSCIWELTELWMDRSVFLFTQMLVNYKTATCASEPNRDSSMMTLGG